MNSEPQPGGQDEAPVTVSVSSAEHVPGFRVEPPPESVISPVRWVGRGEHVVAGGVTITGGLFYFGGTGPSEPVRLDACVVDTRHAVAPRGGGPSQGPSSQGPSLPAPSLFGLAYEELSPEQRRAYLEWLGSDRPGSIAHVGYLNLFLFGLERRVIVDGALEAVSASEYDDIAGELRRLMKAATDWSFLSHAENLLDVISVMTIAPARLYKTSPTVKSTRGYQVPLSVRVAFAQAAVDRVPVPAEWALCWATLDAAIAKRTPVMRSGEQFRLLFAKKYRERFRDGMIVSVNRTALTMPGTAFPALLDKPPPPCLANLPDVSAATGPRKKLQQLVIECAEALRAYSRYLGRYPGSEGTLDAALVLPYDLWPQAFQAQLESLAVRVRESTVVMTFGELLGHFKSMGGITRAKASTLIGALDRVGVAVEPDVRMGARTPKPGDAVALFAAPAGASLPVAEPAYVTASLMVELAASLARIDGAASPRQTTLIHHRIDSWVRFTSDQQSRLLARAAMQLGQLSQPMTLASLKKRLRPLSADARRAVAAFLVQTASAEGVVTPSEVKMLEKVYRALEFEPQKLYADLHQGSAGTPSRSGKPRPAGSSSVPATNTGVPFVLNDARIAALQRETAQVSVLLANVFAEDIVHAVHTPDTVRKEASVEGPGPAEAPGGLLGLDDAHSTFLRLLVTRAQWTRAELSDAAGDLDLMLDGAIEQVNEASLDHWDEALTDGEDPVEINQALVQRLAA
ncbi:TerB N-terminal domain-containing protein [Pararobbsia alpina]|uniref:Tellurite resistance protein TerB n=1 Tax=Pararobbsia alpina TaxID=621374 RepID=A0A6S7BNW0_9BURK|nr:TerB N-terminal domain-containing protein [Pararobbsia alpina]CAB3791208.1 hypothetical protein LMG28138_03140 [Pararobbsia alpina]